MYKKYRKSRYTIKHETQEGTLILFNTFSGAIATIEDVKTKEKVKTILREGLLCEPANELETELINQHFLVHHSTDENRLVDLMRDMEKNRKDHYELILYSTEECNFRCVYCFEKFLRGEMPKEIQQAIIKHILRKAPHINSLNIAWFGGEPLEGVNVIRNINKEVKEISKKFGFTFNSGITTNGYELDENLFRELVDLNIIQYQITLDGPKDTHDTHRILKDGGPTFDRIINNLKSIQKTDLEFKVLIRSNFDKTNKDRMQELIELLSEFLNGDERFQLYFKPVQNYGGTSAKDLPLYDPKESFKVMSEVQKRAHCYFPTSTELLSSLDPMGSVCYAGLPNSFAIGADGTIYKCTLELDEPLNQLGKIRGDGTFDIDEDKLTLWVTIHPSASV
ncbi:radical SAM protein [Geobacillus sp. DSP4a]|uniref:radical SAM protein n=1 Tax=Geobacillus sp. DSP4a TaxID=2508873 RepID=UPI001492264F|nr:radical SAM protein [Geobacillus sp. DSP4a]NNU98736.1 radical SAM protein [Geobacillus sp. DSP4a]